MSLPRPEIYPLNTVHADARRVIAEANLAIGPIVRINHFRVESGAVLGNHFHERVTETFLLASGRVRLTAQAVGEEGAPAGTPSVTALAAPTLVVMPPRVAHAFRFDEPGILICLSDRPYDPGDDHPLRLDT